MAISKLLSKALIELATPTPARSIEAIKSAFSNGSAPLAASAPYRAAEIRLFVDSATLAKSPEMKTFAAFRDDSSKTSESTRPSPSAIFSVIE
ncbi:unannotated protein [freshwater metagenome]|uniref:Unannotated protein n=1 Tax=freshwater metagenome TaxID=449393 RepID=A0A6J6MCZ0_9ZZZZ